MIWEGSEDKFVEDCSVVYVCIELDFVVSNFVSCLISTVKEYAYEETRRKIRGNRRN